MIETRKDNALLRLHLGVVLALALHICVFTAMQYRTGAQPTQNALMGAPTALSVTFTTPKREATPAPAPPQEIIKQPQPKPLPKQSIKKELPAPKPEQEKTLNAIEPAAASVTPHAPAAPAEIPVVRESMPSGRRIAPEYPQRALRLRQEGVVLLHVLVSENGVQQDIKVIKTSRFDLLDEAALRAVRQWRFEPTRRDGVAIKSWIEIPVEFKIR